MSDPSPTNADGISSITQVEHNSAAKAKKVTLRHFNTGTGEYENVSSSNPIPTEITNPDDISSPSLATRIDEADANTTYIGSADPGSATSAAAWLIKKISVSGSATAITYADGNSNFDNIWDNRTSLSYS